jgi:hypothetical protein
MKSISSMKKRVSNELKSISQKNGVGATPMMNSGVYHEDLCYRYHGA